MKLTDPTISTWHTSRPDPDPESDAESDVEADDPGPEPDVWGRGLVSIDETEDEL